jgi:hypothetical protein
MSAKTTFENEISELLQLNKDCYWGTLTDLPSSKREQILRLITDEGIFLPNDISHLLPTFRFYSSFCLRIDKYEKLLLDAIEFIEKSHKNQDFVTKMDHYVKEGKVLTDDISSLERFAILHRTTFGKDLAKYYEMKLDQCFEFFGYID